MADTKLTALSALTPTIDDLLYAVDDPAGTPASKKLVLSALQTLYGIQGITQGGGLTYSSTTAVTVNAIRCFVNGVYVSYAGATFTSVSSMVDIAGSAVTLAANKSYWVFLSSGGVIGIEVNDGTGDGATPVFDTALDYWKSASTGAAWRRIGKFCTHIGAATIPKFRTQVRGRTHVTTLDSMTALNILSATANASYTSITVTPYSTADDIALQIVTTATAASGQTTAGIIISIDGGTSDYSYNQINGLTISIGNTSYTFLDMPYTGDLRYKTANSATGTVWLTGWTQIV